MVRIAVTDSPGTQNAYTISANTNNVLHVMRQAFTYSESTTYTLSFFAKAAEINIVTFSLFVPSVGTITILADSSTNIITTTKSTWTVQFTSVTPFANNWSRYAVTFRTTTGGAGNIDLGNTQIGTNVGNGVSGVLVFGPQLEVGSFTTSYIPTTSAAVTRASDFASVTGSADFNPAEGTFGVEFQTIFTTDGVPRYIPIVNNNQLMYLAANTGTVTSFDGHVPALVGWGRECIWSASKSIFGILGDKEVVVGARV